MKRMIVCGVVLAVFAFGTGLLSVGLDVPSRTTESPGIRAQVLAAGPLGPRVCCPDPFPSPEGPDGR